MCARTLVIVVTSQIGTVRKLYVYTEARSAIRDPVNMPLPKELPRTGQAATGVGASAAPSSARGERQGGEGSQVLANRYRLSQKLGSGSFGSAYLVFDLKANNERYSSAFRVLLFEHSDCPTT